MSFDDDLYDGFIDTRLYSSLNVRSRQGLDRTERYYDRNVIVTPAFEEIGAASRPESTKRKRKRTKPIQNKVYYPRSDSDSATSLPKTSQPQAKPPEESENPFVQKIPVYIYEHYDRNNKYLPKSSRKVYKCKCKCQNPNEVARKDSAEVIYINVQPSTAKTSLSSPHAEEQPEVKECCHNLEAKMSQVEKQLKAYYDYQKHSKERHKLKKEINENEDEVFEEQEITTIDMTKSTSHKTCKSPKASKTSRSKTSKIAFHSPSPEPKSDSSHAPTYHPSVHILTPHLVCADDCARSTKSSKSSKTSKSGKSCKSKNSKTSKTETCPKSCPINKKSSHSSKVQLHKCESKKSSRHEPARKGVLTVQTLPPVGVAPCFQVCKNCKNNECLHKIAIDGTSPCICYQNGRYSQSTSSPGYSQGYSGYPGTGTASSPGYSSSKYYSGTRTYGYGSGTRTGTRSGTGTGYSSGYAYGGRDTGYSGTDYYSGTTRGSKGYPSGDASRRGESIPARFRCDSRTCGFGSNPLDVGYATTIVTRFSKYTVYEVLRPSMKRPPTMCRVTENVFVVKNKFRL